MNFYSIFHFLGWVLEVSGVSLLLPAFVGVAYGESVWLIYFLTALFCLLLGLPLVIKKPKYKSFYAKEGFVTVAAAWVIMSLIGAVPFYAGGEIKSYLDAVFETASGFTTTGSSILVNIAALSHAALFWRSFTHWIGGMGVLVFLIVFIPKSGGGTIQLLKAESPGPAVGKIVPKIRETALILYILYSFMTILETVMLLFGGIPWFDAITTAFATAGTGGFSVRNASIAFYNNAYVEVVITVFMLLFGVNFNIYYLALNKRFRDIRDNQELRAYLLVVFFAVVFVVLSLMKAPVYQHNIGGAVKDSAFSVASIISTTGFCTVDFNAWPAFSKLVLFLLMFIGACAGSTGGGLKVSRLIILFKSSFSEVSRFIHPKSVRSVTIDKKKVDDQVVRQAKSYFAIYILIYAVSCLIISLNDFDFSTTMSSVAAALNNIGPGFELVGPKGNYAMFSPLSKVVLIFDMLAGRLELFPMLIIFSPATIKETVNAVKRRKIWKKKPHRI